MCTYRMYTPLLTITIVNIFRSKVVSRSLNTMQVIFNINNILVRIEYHVNLYLARFAT